MRSMAVFGYFVLSLAVPVAARAAVVTVDVTIKAINPQSRALTVAYKAGAEEKTIELDVSRKAEITVNEKPGTLALLAPGQTAKVSFDKGLAVVTKIEASGAPALGREVHRLTLQISEVGDAILRIEKTSTLPEDAFKGTPFTFSRWPHTKATKGQDGTFHVVHEFRDADEPEALAMQEPLNVSLERDSGVLTFTPSRLPEGYQVKRGAVFPYGKKLRLPLTIRCDIAAFGGGIFQVEVRVAAQPGGLLLCGLTSDNQDLAAPFDTTVSWIESGDGGKQNQTELFKERVVTLDQPLEKRFRLPLPNAKITDAFLVELATALGKKPTTVARLELQGPLSPMFGFSLAERDSLVFANKVSPNGLAEKAGFQPGDVLQEINGNRPQSLKDAMAMLARLPIGEKVVFTIGRGNETQKLSAVAE
jgi:hypothetical protein